MPISHSDYVGLTCPACGARFEADVWTLVDAAERSDLAQELRDGALNTATCPKCGAQTTAGTALLFHDPAGRRVYFAVPPNVDEHAWREQAQELLYQLVNSLPEDERRPYLGDVQVEHELDGVRRAVLRHDRRRGAGRQADKDTGRQGDREQGRQADGEMGRPKAAAPAPSSSPEPSAPNTAPPIEALRALLAADNDSEFQAILAEHPELLGEDTDQAVRELADQAYASGERDVANALRELRTILARLRAGQSARPAPAGDTPAPDVQNASQAPASQPVGLSDGAYQALLHAASADTLLAATRDYPALLELWADDDLGERIEDALDEGNERLARTIESRREGLAELRARLSERTVLQYAVQALLAAEGEDAVAGILSSHPILLTDTAQNALSELAADALARDDHELAGKATSSQALLHTVRAGLEEH